MKKRIISLFLAVGLVVSFGVNVLADPLSDMLNQKDAQQSQLNNDSSELKKTEDKLQQMQSAVEMMDFKIEGIMRQLDDNKKAIAKSEADIVQAQKEVDKAQSDIEEQQKLFDKRMRAMYMNGSEGYLSVILNSDGVSDLISRVEALSKIIQFDKKVVRELEEKKVVLEQKKKSLDEENKRLLALKADNEQKLASLNASKAEQVVMLKDLQKQQNAQDAKVKESQAALDTIKKKIKAMQDAAPKYNPSRGAAPATSSNIIAYAYNFLGMPYSWGGTTPYNWDTRTGGFDCSGYTQYVYAHFGIYIGRTTYDQINDGVAVSRDQLQPGDLVFFGSWGNPHHVGFYLGDNYYLHAPQTGDVIKVSPMTRSDFVTGRRVAR